MVRRKFIYNNTTETNNKQGIRQMHTYTIINRPQSEQDTGFNLFEPCKIKGIPTNMTFIQAGKLAQKARNAGHDVCVYNTKAQ